jgi:hypothetical protein
MRVVAALLVLLTGCSIGFPTPTPDPAAMPGVVPAQTVIGVFGPADWVPPQELSLEIGDQAWSILAEGGHGVAGRNLSDVTFVRLVGVDDCHVYAAFEAAPGAFYSIRFAEDGSVSVKDITAQGIEDGPALGEREGGLADCHYL